MKGAAIGTVRFAGRTVTRVGTLRETYGPGFVAGVRSDAKLSTVLQPRPSDRWHLDEMVVHIAGERMYLWRAVDDERAAGVGFNAVLASDDLSEACIVSRRQPMAP